MNKMRKAAEEEEEDQEKNVGGARRVRKERTKQGNRSIGSIRFCY
jgi:hypothetical protein